jgi:hypothetical protein
MRFMEITLLRLDVVSHIPLTKTMALAGEDGCPSCRAFASAILAFGWIARKSETGDHEVNGNTVVSDCVFDWEGAGKVAQRPKGPPSGER